MTIEQILNNTNSAEELKNKFLARITKTRLVSSLSRAKTDFLENIQRTLNSIADGTITCSYCPNPDEEVKQSAFSEEDKKELFQAVKAAALNALEVYKKSLDCIFKNDNPDNSKEEEQPQKTEIEFVATPVQEQLNYFGY